MLRGQATVLFLVSIVVVAADAHGAGPMRLSTDVVAQVATPTPGGYIPWFTTTPTPIPNAYAGIENAFAAGIIYNTGSGGTGSQSGISIAQTNDCNFLCFGKQGTASVRVLMFGNDRNANSYTEIGAPDACSPNCPGEVTDQAFGISIFASPSPNPTPTNLGNFLAIDGAGNLGIASNVAAGGAIVAGAGDGDPTGPTPYPPPSPGSLVSRTGSGTGDVLLGDSSNYVKCDYGETTPGSVTCGAPFWSAVSTSALPGPVPPCYQNGGAACYSTFHSVKNTGGLGITTSGFCTSNTWCSLSGNTITLSASAVFADTYYACSLSSSSATKLSLTVNAQTTSSFTIQVYNNSGGSILGGTPLPINYMCSGN